MKSLAPYQVFFPLGILSALLAVGVWLVQDMHWFSTPAILIHSRLIVGGFLWSFAVGFLMTAIPRMTGTEAARPLEYGLALFLILQEMVSSWFMDGAWFYRLNMAVVAFLIIYGGRRILRSTKTVPVFFSHVGLGAVLAFVGAFYHARGNSFLGIHLYHVGAFLLLVLGIGTRFFSFLSGLPSEFENAGRRQRWEFHALGFATAGALYLAGRGFSGAYSILTVLMLIYLFHIWKVQRPSARPSALKVAVRATAGVLPLTFLLCALWPGFYVTWFHLLFIGGFALMTFSVATRVVLAHGSYSLNVEMSSRALRWCVALMAAALVCRIPYGLTEGWVRKSFLHSAATFWLLAIFVWSFSFFIRIFRPGAESKPSC